VWILFQNASNHSVCESFSFFSSLFLTHILKVGKWLVSGRWETPNDFCLFVVVFVFVYLLPFSDTVCVRLLMPHNKNVHWVLQVHIGFGDPDPL